MEQLQDRVAVVTGAASGLGLAMSNRFAQAGMKVVLADIEADRLDAVVGELRAAGHDATGVVTDVADADAVVITSPRSLSMPMARSTCCATTLAW